METRNRIAGNCRNEFKRLKISWIRVMEIMEIVEIIEVNAITYSSTQENYHFFPEFPVTIIRDACPKFPLLRNFVERVVGIRVPKLPATR